MFTKDLRRICISPDTTILESARTMERNRFGLCLVVDNQDCLIGTVNDGDVRRAILNESPLGDAVSRLLDWKKATPYEKPTVAPIGRMNEFYLMVLRKESMVHLPLVDEEGKLKDLVRMIDLDPDRTASFLSDGCVWENGMLRNRITGRTVKAILPVHLLGHPVDLDTFRDLADQYELILIEDSTESIGAEYKGRKVGCHRDVGCLSFNGNKMITTGGGGMIVTDRIAWSERAGYLTQQAKDDPIEYVHSAVGYNYRLSNIQAAMGVAQLERLDSFVEAKKRIADLYRRAFAGLPGVTPQVEKPWATSANWLLRSV